MVEKQIDKKLTPFQVGLTGKLITSTDPSRLILEENGGTQIDNFKSLKNIRYTDNGIRGITGMSKINTTALSTQLKSRTVHHFTKSQPAESHVLVQSFDTNIDNSKVFRNSTSIPNTGDFNATALHTDARTTGSITAFATSGTRTQVTSATHGLNNGDAITITGTTSYNGTFNVQDVATNTYIIKVTFVADDATGTWATRHRGRFENGQLGRLLYCNGAETMVWGGDESRLSSFKVFNPDSSFSYDYTEKVQNTLTDASNVAALFQSTGAGSEVLLLLHCDGTDASTTFTDSSPTTPHTVTAVGNAQIDTANPKFGTGGGLFDGAGDRLTIPDNADFDMSGGTNTLDLWGDFDDLNTEAGLYSQGNTGGDTDYMALTVTTGGAVKLSIFAASSEVVTLQTADGVITTNTYTHIELSISPGSSNTDYRIFVGGVQKAFVNDAQLPADYTSTVVIGARIRGNTTDLPFTGHLDEVRVTNSAEHTTDFSVATTAYGTDNVVNIRIGNILPVKGFKFTVSTANATSGTMTVFYWSGSGWAAVSNLVDNTASGGVPLAQTGTITFDSTESVAKQKIIDKVLGFYFLIQITSADTTTRISSVTVTEPWQDLQDFWDGELRIVNSAQLFEDSKNKDNTVNVLEDDFIFDDSTAAGDLSTYMTMSSLVTTTEYLTVGFFERQQGLQCKLIPNHTNTTAGTVIEVEYWSGAAWVTVGAISDGTIENDISFTKSGFVTWNPIAENTEFRREINKEDPLFYYKLSWNKSFSNDVLCFHISGIPVQKQIENFSFSLNAQGRTFLFSNQSDRKNSAIVSNIKTLNAFNGKDSGDGFEFGDETSVTAAAEIFTKLTTGAVSDIVVAKADATFLITGDNPENWIVTEISEDTGCPAPYTLKPSPIGLEFSPLQSKQVVVWQSANGIVMYDSNSIFPISDTISNFFDQTRSEAINLDKIADSYGFWDVSNGFYEYHWLFASGTSTTLDKELIFDERRQKWWDADRSSGLRLQCGTDVKDTSGAHYNYAMEDVGFMHRLENGQDFSGTAIPYEMEFGDIPLTGDINIESVIEFLQMIMVQKTSGTVTITHYGDGEDTGTTLTMSQIKADHRITMPVERMGQTKFGSHVLHRLKFTISTSDQTIGFEPLYVGGFITTTRKKLKD